MKSNFNELSSGVRNEEKIFSLSGSKPEVAGNRIMIEERAFKTYTTSTTI